LLRIAAGGEERRVSAIAHWMDRLTGNLRHERRKLKRRATAVAAGQAAIEFPEDFSDFTCALMYKVSAYTMTSVDEIAALEQAVRHVVAAGIPGAFVECGVLQGGSSMAMAYTLLDLGVRDRELYLFDTFEGMPEPTARDVSVTGKGAMARWRRERRANDGSDWAGSDWCRAEIDQVRANLVCTGYDPARLHFVPGLVQDTLPVTDTGPIALLRLDTDWYESTKAEMTHLFPRLASGGVLIVDDYGRWQGCREAVDEYLAEHGLHLMLARISSQARLAVKP
jgi:O-methyltransferase